MHSSNLIFPGIEGSQDFPTSPSGFGGSTGIFLCDIKKSSLAQCLVLARKGSFLPLEKASSEDIWYHGESPMCSLFFKAGL